MGSLFSRSKKEKYTTGDGGSSGSNKKGPNNASTSINSHNQNKLTEKDKATLELKNTRDKITKFKKQLEQESESLDLKIRELMKKGFKDSALMVLKLKKHKKQSMENLDAQLYTIKEQIDTLDWAVINKQVLDAMKAGNAELKRLNGLYSVDQIQEMLDDTRDLQEAHDEIAEAISEQVRLSPEEEQAILAELDELSVGSSSASTSISASTTASTATAAASTNSTYVFPSAPTNATTATAGGNNTVVATSNGKTLVFPAAPTHSNTNASADSIEEQSDEPEERVAIAS